LFFIGITAEQAQSGEVMRICLSEIDKCRPFFLSLLGNRYGWIPNSFDPNIVSDFPWLKKLTPGEKSITEMVIYFENNF